MEGGESVRMRGRKGASGEIEKHLAGVPVTDSGSGSDTTSFMTLNSSSYLTDCFSLLK